MPATVATQRGSHPAAPTTPIPTVDAALHLSTRTVTWLADHPEVRRLVGSVLDKLTELDRADQCPSAINALRRSSTPTSPPQQADAAPAAG